MSTGNNSTASNSVNLSTVRERRREGVCCLTVEMYEAEIAEATAPRPAECGGNASNVLDAWYASHLSDAALQWLADNNVIEPEQRALG
jgi:hypothetical protein